MLFAAFLALAANSALAPTAPGPATQVIRHMGPPPPVVTGDHASVPIEFNAGLPTFLAAIGGQSFKLGFDTGAAGGAHLSDKIVAALSLQPVGEALATDPSGKNPIRLKLYPVDDLAIGSIKISHWIGTSVPEMPAKLQPLDGIIGLGAFDGFVVTLDYAGRRLMLDRGALPEPDGRTIFAYDDIIPIVPLTVEGKTVRAHLDTGNVTAALIVPENFAGQLSRAAESRPVGVAHTISNAIQMKAEPITGTARVGDVPLTAAEVRFPSVIDIANIGSLALGNLMIKIDPKNHRIQFLRPAGTPVS